MKGSFLATVICLGIISAAFLGGVAAWLLSARNPRKSRCDHRSHHRHSQPPPPSFPRYATTISTGTVSESLAAPSDLNASDSNRMPTLPMSSCNPPLERAPLRPNFWTPQPEHFAAREQKLLNDFNSAYITERFGNLRFAIRNFADNAPWNATTVSKSFVFRAHVQQTLDAHQYPYKEIELARLALLCTRLSNATSRGSALYALLSWIMIANTSLHGSPQYTLLPPVLREDLKQPLPNPPAEDHLLGLLRDLLGPFLTLHDDESDALRRCVRIATRFGLALQRDLRPWGLSFCFAHTVPSPGGLREPAQVLPFERESLWKFDTEDRKDLVTEKEVTLFPALLALGDDSGRRHEVPIVIVAAQVGSWKELMKLR
ncbi:hypothetical protein DL95DRAFT_495441 [Leptodontidium sp. 2 PMI_412]|nr:hypothetical protein DL95DRAFT_495441 [Leptodontidium sp. 2 PMI_412]